MSLDGERVSHSRAMRIGRTSPVTRIVLIADDSISSRGMVCIVLRSSGFECVEAADGKQALEILQSQPEPSRSATRKVR